MSKAVMLSIRPRWCELIASGEKTIEVRKTRPKIDTPFKCYIYQTATGQKDWQHPCVIGEFVCDKIISVDCDSIGPFDAETKDYIAGETCLSRKMLWSYTNGCKAFGWHISDLKIYDKPKALSEFAKPYDAKHCVLPTKPTCNNCDRCYIKRPPQSWCYVEELEVDGE